jgi:hypothetical protein
MDLRGKTYGEVINMISDDTIRESIPRNILRDNINLDLLDIKIPYNGNNNNPITFDWVIGALFQWSNSNEGGTYWYDLVESYRNGDLDHILVDKNRVIGDSKLTFIWP